MIANITIGQYIEGNSILHRLDPRTKILATIFLMVVIFTFQNITCYIVFMGIILAAIVFAKIPLMYTIRGLKPILILIIFTVTINLFTIEGDVIADLGFANITYEGLVMAIKLAFRLILLVTTASILTLTTTPIHLTDGIESLLKPLSKIGFPSHELALMMTIALRFIPTLIQETDKIMKAQKSRGANFETGSIINRAKNFLPILIPLFVNSFKRADDLAIAMEARGYKGAEGRTRLNVLKIQRIDVYFSFCLIAITIINYFLDRFVYII